MLYILFLYYSQSSGYFVGVFDSKEKAINSVDFNGKKVDHIGRKDNEDMWYEIEEIPINKYVGIIV